MPHGLPALLACVLWTATAGQARAQFTDVSASTGADVGAVKEGGATFVDLDGDGWLDLVVNQVGRGQMLRNTGGDTPMFVDITDTAAAVFATAALARSVVAADLNHDGHPDLVRSNSGRLQVSVNGGPPDYAFGREDFYLDDASDPTINVEGVAFVDFDGDGWLDLFVENAGPRLYRNPADGTVDFALVPASTTGLADPAVITIGAADYVGTTDFDVDGDVDLAHRNALLVPLFSNDGDGTFTALPSPDIDSDNSIKGGIRFCDFDNDGLFDLFFAGEPGGGRNTVHVQTSAGEFTRTVDPAPSIGRIVDAACGDVDHDGDLDLYLTRSGADVLYLNQFTETGTLAFAEATTGPAAGLVGRSATFVDYDNDGDLDLYVNRTGISTTDPMTMETVREPADNVLYRNDHDGDDYLMVEVQALAGACPAPSRRSHVGAVVSVAGPMGWESGVREVNGGEGRGTQGPPRVHFGLPMTATESHTVTVRFTGTEIPNVDINVVPAELGPYHLLTVDGFDIDGDGIPTMIEFTEAGDRPDPDGDGRPAWNDDDSDGDGISDAIEAGDGDPCTPTVDDDGNGTPDYLEAATEPRPDAGPTDGGTDSSTDGGPSDSAVAPVDSSLGQVTAHGSGCIRCATAPGSGDHPALLLTGLVLAYFARRRSRRR